MVTSTAIDSTLFVNQNEGKTNSSSKNEGGNFSELLDNLNKAYEKPESTKNEKVNEDSTNNVSKNPDAGEIEQANTEPDQEKIKKASDAEKTKESESSSESKKVENNQETKNSENKTDKDNDSNNQENPLNKKDDSVKPETQVSVKTITTNIVEVLQATVINSAVENATQQIDIENTTNLQNTQQEAPQVKSETTAAQISQASIAEKTVAAKITNDVQLNVDATVQVQDKDLKQVNKQKETQEIPNQIRINSPSEELTDSQQNQASKNTGETKIQVLNTIANESNIKPLVTKETEQNNLTQIKQETIDKTEAKITAVESNKNDSATKDYLGRQNANEQAIKLALETPEQKPTAEHNSFNAKMMDSQDLSVQINTNNLKSNNIQSQVQAQAPREINQAEIISQINKQLDGLKQEGTTKVTIILKPENLGKIHLELINSKDGLTAQMTTDSHQVKDLLDKSLNSLKESLGGQGVNVNNLNVKVSETQKQEHSAFNFDGQTGQNNNQEQTNNSKQTQENKFSVNEEPEFIGETELETTQDSTISERTISLNSKLGQINYKI